MATTNIRYLCLGIDGRLRLVKRQPSREAEKKLHGYVQLIPTAANEATLVEAADWVFLQLDGKGTEEV